jgi:hypothetical protein
VRLADGRDLVVWQEAAAGLETLRVGVQGTAPSPGSDGGPPADPAPRGDLPATGGGIGAALLLVAGALLLRARTASSLPVEVASPPSVRTSGCADRSCAAGPRRRRAGGPS